VVTVHVSEGEPLEGNEDKVTTYLEAIADNQEKQRRAREIAGRLDDKAPNRRRIA